MLIPNMLRSPALESKLFLAEIGRSNASAAEAGRCLTVRVQVGEQALCDPASGSIPRATPSPETGLADGWCRRTHIHTPLSIATSCFQVSSRRAEREVIEAKTRAIALVPAAGNSAIGTRRSLLMNFLVGKIKLHPDIEADQAASETSQFGTLDTAGSLFPGVCLDVSRGVSRPRCVVISTTVVPAMTLDIAHGNGAAKRWPQFRYGSTS